MALGLILSQSPQGNGAGWEVALGASLCGGALVAASPDGSHRVRPLRAGTDKKTLKELVAKGVPEESSMKKHLINSSMVSEPRFCHWLPSQLRVHHVSISQGKSQSALLLLVQLLRSSSGSLGCSFWSQASQ